MSKNPGILLAGYMMAPADAAGEEAFFAGLTSLDIAGLEYAMPIEGTRSLEPGWVERNVQPGWDLMVTLVPSMMVRLSTDPTYGLSSTNETSRAHALADIARARDLAVSLADAYGHRRVVAIELHSAPGPGGGSTDALARSIEEILSWDVAGAEILLEHCDAAVEGRTAAKGFWTLEDEMTAVRAVGLAPDIFGMSVNWGRSVIEGRSTTTAVEHVQAVAEAGLLRALVFSGATGEETAWSPAWADTHIPPRGDDPALEISSASLLGITEIAETLRVAGDVPRIGLKVAVRPDDADVAARLAVARASIELIAAARESITLIPAAGESIA